MSTTVGLSSAPAGHRFFRELNKRVRELVDHDAEEYFFCECADAQCTGALRMRVAEYDEISRDPDCYAVLPGHDDHGRDEVLERNDRYVIVRPGESSETSEVRPLQIVHG